MAALQFTPMGVREVEPSETAGDTVHAGGAAIAAREHVDAEPAPLIRHSALPTATLTRPAISPKTVIQAARSRVKEIRAELRNKRALEKELAQLERLLAATKKPPASLTQINSRRAG